MTQTAAAKARPWLRKPALCHSRFASSNFPAPVARGIYPAVAEGFGDALPIADSGSENGRVRNGRVEVWLRR